MESKCFAAPQIVRILNKHGYPSSKLRSWFRTVRGAISWMEKNIERQLLDASVEDYKNNTSDDDPAFKTLDHETLFESSAMLEWADMLDEVPFSDVQGHFYSGFVN